MPAISSRLWPTSPLSGRTRQDSFFRFAVTLGVANAAQWWSAGVTADNFTSADVSTFNAEIYGPGNYRQYPIDDTVIWKGRAMTPIERAREIGEKVANAFASGRLPDDALYAPDATGWHNTDEIEMPHSSAHERWSLVRKLFPDFHAEDVHVHAWEGGFAFQYAFVGNGADGASIRIPGCIIATLGSAGITRMQEYVDSAHATPLVEAMRAQGLMA